MSQQQETITDKIIELNRQRTSALEDLIPVARQMSRSLRTMGDTPTSDKVESILSGLDQVEVEMKKLIETNWKEILAELQKKVLDR